ncbi:MAG: hypothetical protein K2J08_11620 [Ruminococcus sp.]|nr:hypothetical protein [Ruminococcus sp.]
MTDEEKDFVNRLKDFDDDIVEEIAGSYPALDEETKERILKKCISAYGGKSEESGEELTVSGTEPYTRPKWYKYASYVAVAVVAVVGVGSVAMLHRNMNTVDTFDMKNTPVFTEESDDNSTAVATSTTAFNGKTFEGYMAGTAITTAQTAEEVTETTAESSAEKTEKTTEKSTEKSSTPKRTTQSQAETPTKATETTLSTDIVSTETESTEEISIEAEYMEMKTEDITDEEPTTEAVINSSAFDSVFVGEKWVCQTDTGEFVYEFYDNRTGIFISPDGAEVTRFEYEFGDSFYFVMSFVTENGNVTTKEGEIQNDADKESFIVKWNDGTTQTFYNKTVWAGMVN